MRLASLLCCTLFLGGTLACATPDEPRYAVPPPGSFSPFAPPDQSESDRDIPEPQVEEEDEPEDDPTERE